MFLKKVLLSPALEHAVGNLDVAQVRLAGDHLRLMAVVAQARNLPQAQLTFEQADGLIVQKIVNPAPVALSTTPDEAPLIDATAATLATGQHVEAILDHRGEQLWLQPPRPKTMLTLRSPTSCRTSRSRRGEAFVNAALTSR